MTTPSAPTGDHGGLRADERATLREAVQHIPWGRWDDAVCRTLYAAVERILTDRIAAHPEPEPAQDAEVARIIDAHATVATGLGEWCCKCSPMEWRPSALRGRHLAAVLVAAGMTR